MPSLLVDYAFDGMTLGYAPDIDALPGAYAKICYGRGFESGFNAGHTANSIKDTDMLGIAVVPDRHRHAARLAAMEPRLQHLRRADDEGTPISATPMPRTNLGDIDWYGAGC